MCLLWSFPCLRSAVLRGLDLDQKPVHACTGLLEPHTGQDILYRGKRGRIFYHDQLDYRDSRSYRCVIPFWWLLSHKCTFARNVLGLALRVWRHSLRAPNRNHDLLHKGLHELGMEQAQRPIDEICVDRQLFSDTKRASKGSSRSTGTLTAVAIDNSGFPGGLYHCFRLRRIHDLRQRAHH